jgi:hypothetical protein
MVLLVLKYWILKVAYGVILMTVVEQVKKSKFGLILPLRREKKYEEDVQKPAKFAMDVLLVVFSRKEKRKGAESLKNMKWKFKIWNPRMLCFYGKYT